MCARFCVCARWGKRLCTIVAQSQDHAAIVHNLWILRIRKFSECVEHVHAHAYVHIHFSLISACKCVCTECVVHVCVCVRAHVCVCAECFACSICP